MSNERIDLVKELEWLHRLVKIKQVADLNKHDVIVDSGYIERLIAELKRCYEKLDEAEYRLEMAEDVLGRSDWNSVYRELIRPPE